MKNNCCKECVHYNYCKKNDISPTINKGWKYKGKVCCDRLLLRNVGIYNTMAKEFQFGIDEPTPKRAQDKLFKKIGYDSYKWRFEPRDLPPELRKRVIDKSGNKKEISIA